MNLRFIGTLAILPIIAATIVLACGKGSDGGVIDALSEEDRRQVEERIEDLQDLVHFTVLFPDYLPDGIDPIPLTLVHPVENIARLEFEPDGATGEEIGVPLLIVLFEHGGPPEAVTCDTLYIPTKPGYSCADVHIAGGSASSQLNTSDPDRVSHSVFGVVQDRSIEVFVSWNGAPEQGAPVELSEERKNVAFDILTSLRPFE